MADKKIKEEKTAKTKTKAKATKKKEIKKTKKKKENYFKQVRKELKLVKWPSAKEVLKYTGSTIVFCLIICAFFLLLNIILSYVKGLFV